LLVEIHAIAKLYGKLPSEVLRLSIDDWSLNVAIAEAGLKEEERQREKAARAR
jgi:hypothetical protein